ncbi:MAG: sugar ABC transporter substrate-binding protein [Candidatus Humimicrobiaceae bacterium]
MKKVKLFIALVLTLALVATIAIGCKTTATATTAAATTAAAETTAAAATTAAAETTAAVKTMKASDVHLGYVIHVPIPFTDAIKRGAEAAAKDYGVSIEVVAPSKYDLMEQVSLFEGLVTKGVNGIVTVAADAQGWVVPINNAVDKGVLVYTANVGSPDSKATGHVGTAGYAEGLSLGAGLLALPEVQALGGKGKVILGECDPSIPVLVGRGNGVMDALKENSAGWEVLGPFDSGMSNDASYTFWETQYTANPDMAIGLGSCAFDVPSMVRHKEKTPDAKYIIVGYDLEPDALKGIADGIASLTQGQHPFLQGYLPIAAMCEYLINGKPLATGWINPGSEIVTKANVAELTARDTDPVKELAWYEDYIKKNFTPIVGKPFTEYKQTGRE